MTLRSFDAEAALHTEVSDSNGIHDVARRHALRSGVIIRIRAQMLKGNVFLKLTLVGVVKGKDLVEAGKWEQLIPSKIEAKIRDRSHNIAQRQRSTKIEIVLAVELRLVRIPDPGPHLERTEMRTHRILPSDGNRSGEIALENVIVRIQRERFEKTTGKFVLGGVE